jgi:hypothetical protein
MPGGFCSFNEPVLPRSISMSDILITPSIEVTIGRQTRLYHAFVTTAPSALDAPSTVTLYVGPLKDVAGLAADDDAFRSARVVTPSRVVLVDSTELAWQRASCRGKSHRLVPADPILISPPTLQQWLWQRLQFQFPAHA